MTSRSQARLFDRSSQETHLERKANANKEMSKINTEKLFAPLRVKTLLKLQARNLQCSSQSCDDQGFILSPEYTTLRRVQPLQ